MAFVYSFVVILLLDLLLGIALDGIYFSLWPEAQNCFRGIVLEGFGDFEIGRSPFLLTTSH